MSFKISSKFLPLISIIHLTFSAIIAISIYNTFVLGNFIFSISCVLISMWFFTGNIICEVYGYSCLQRNMLHTFHIQLIICAIVLAVRFCINHSFINNEQQLNSELLQLSYYVIKGITANLIAIIGFNLVNSFLIPRLKILLNCKYFTLHENGVSIISELFFIITISFISMLYLYPLSTTFKIVISSVLVYLILNISLMIPLNIIVSILKQVEYIDQKYNYTKISIFDVILENAIFEEKHIKPNTDCVITNYNQKDNKL